MNIDITECKRRLPMPTLLAKLGFADRSKASARCPFHQPDNNPSFGIDAKKGVWLWNCQAGCGGGDEVDFIAKLRNTDKGEAIREFARLAGVTSENKSANTNLGSADEEAVKRLAAMSPIEYDRVRKAEAEKLGCQLSTLDKLVDEKRRTKSGDDESLQGEAVICPDIEDWPDPVNGADILSGIAASVTAYCALPEGAADVVALFCAHTHCFELFRISPRLHITSPTHGCGKSTLRDVVALFVRRPLAAEQLSTAVGFRVVNDKKPTLLADEIDRWLVNNDELCGFFNSNYKRGAVFLRCEGDDNKVRAFNAYSPTVICGIGALRGRLATLHDRSIVIRLAKAKPGELSLPFNEENTQKEHELTRKLARWITDNRTQIAECKPTLPEGVHNRLADNWRPLFAIAEVLGNEWRERIFEAFAALNSNKLDVEALGIQLLRDIHDIYKEHPDDITDGWISSNDLIAHLKGKTESPWDEANKGGKPINARWLSVRLSEYDIKPGKLPGGHERGYEVASFQNAFDRYVLSVQASRQPILRGKTALTDSLTDRKAQASSQVSSPPARENDPCLTDRHIGEPEKKLPADKGPRKILADFVGAVRAVPSGIHPKGSPDCVWGADPNGNYYPSEYTAAVDCVKSANANEQNCEQALRRLVFKADAETAKGTPLVMTDGCEWKPSELETARTYARALAAREEREILAAYA